MVRGNEEWDAKNFMCAERMEYGKTADTKNTQRKRKRRTRNEARVFFFRGLHEIFIGEVSNNATYTRENNNKTFHKCTVGSKGRAEKKRQDKRTLP